MGVSKHNALAPEIMKMIVTGSDTRADALIVVESLVVGAMLYYFPGNLRGQAEVVESLTGRVLERLSE